MNVYDDYKYPINEIWYARELKDYNFLKRLLKDYKRLNQGVVSVPMWHTKEEDDAQICGIIPYRDNEFEGFYMSTKDRRRNK